MRGQTNHAHGGGLYQTTRQGATGPYRYWSWRWFEDGRQRERGIGNAERVSEDEARRAVRRFRQALERDRDQSVRGAIEFHSLRQEITHAG